jgi:hypothetical protein
MKKYQLTFIDDFAVCINETEPLDSNQYIIGCDELVIENAAFGI